MNLVLYCTLKQRMGMIRFGAHSLFAAHTPFCKLDSSVKMDLVPSQSVQLQESVGIASSTMTQTIAFQEESSLPDHLTTFQCCFQVTFLVKCLHVYEYREAGLYYEALLPCKH